MIVGEKFHSLNSNGKKQGCLARPSPYTLLYAFGLFFIANVGPAAFQLCGKVHGLNGGMNWLARFFSEPDVEFLGRSSHESALPMKWHSFRRPGNRRVAGVCDLSRELLCSPEATVAGPLVSLPRALEPCKGHVPIGVNAFAPSPS